MLGLILCAWAIPFGAEALPTQISTFAGGIGDGGPALRASIRDAYGIAADSLGNVYVADSAHHRVRRVATDGTITTVAGRDGYGYNGDGGLAVDATLYQPFGVAVDAGDSLIIADTQNHRIRKISVTGVISTIAGVGVKGFSGDGGPATAAKLSAPADVAVGPDGGIYISDLGNHRIREIRPDGTITTIAGTGIAGFSGDGGPSERARISPAWGISVGDDGTIYIADTWNHRVRSIRAGIIRTIAGVGAPGLSGDGGPGTKARTWYPWAATAGANGDVFIADLGNNRIRRIDSHGIISTYTGGAAGYAGDGGTRTGARYRLPSDVIFDRSSAMVVADALNYRVRRISPSGTVSSIAGNGVASPVGDGGLATSGQLRFPTDVTFDRAGNLYVADAGNFRVRKISPSGVISTVAGRGTRGFTGHGLPAVHALLGGPRGIAIDRSARLWMADTGSNTVRVVTPSGILYDVAGTGVAGFAGDGGPARYARLNMPSGIAADRAGNIYVADSLNHRIRKIVPGSWRIWTVAGTGRPSYNGDEIPARVAALSFPRDLAFDAAGNLLVADAGNNRVRSISPSGIITTVAGTGERGFNGDGIPAQLAQLDTPSGVDVDASGGIIVTDSLNNRIRLVDASGVIRTVAGWSSPAVPVVAPRGIFGPPGDGLPSLAAQLSFPLAAVSDPAGNVYIADTFNNKIRRVDTAIPRV